MENNESEKSPVEFWTRTEKETIQNEEVQKHKKYIRTDITTFIICMAISFIVGYVAAKIF